jgi:hypothetical protein
MQLGSESLGGTMTLTSKWSDAMPEEYLQLLRYKDRTFIPPVLISKKLVYSGPGIEPVIAFHARSPHHGDAGPASP